MIMTMTPHMCACMSQVSEVDCLSCIIHCEAAQCHDNDNDTHGDAQARAREGDEIGLALCLDCVLSCLQVVGLLGARVAQIAHCLQNSGMSIYVQIHTCQNHQVLRSSACLHTCMITAPFRFQPVTLIYLGHTYMRDTQFDLCARAHVHIHEANGRRYST
jgi:hypothetical protein